MSDVIQQYRKAEDPIPSRMTAWQVYGAGMENVGREGKPEEIGVPEPGPDELLVRIDANGLCFSDIKIIKLGEEHPRLKGRDLRRQPIILGHETAMTVVKVGANIRDAYHVGDRFIIQADVLYKGQGMAFGYLLPGGLEQYCLIGREIIEGDEGCYLLPVKPETGYVEAALTEPWACVEASYRVSHRSNVKDGGVAVLMIAPGEDLADYTYDGLGRPCKVLATDHGQNYAYDARQSAQEMGIEWLSVPAAPDWEALSEEHTGGAGFDDVIALGTPDPDLFERVARLIAKDGVMAVLSEKPLSRPVSIDVGRIHYENITYIGSTNRNVVSAYRGWRGADLTKGGVVWLIGAGGPMGQMHLQRALEKPDGPSVVVATDLDLGRLETLRDRFSGAAEKRNIALHLFNPNAMEKGAFEEKIAEITGGRGFDEIVVLVPVPAVIADASRHLAAHGGMNIFAGVGIGTMAAIDLSGTWRQGARFWGSSGSTIADLRVMLEKTEAKEVVPNNSVAAIGGMKAAREGLMGLAAARFPGKTVIFPQIPDLPLTALTDLHDVLPNVAARLKDGKFWCKEAEEELLRTYMGKDATADAA
ncbi:MAG TPA: alcohol dehydrogenase catalytic domain-containing protein [Armatimonadota bacterium]|nr:alcohol dehydrogenase catalytic domain-containing protein [Armatimonadota bacterium]